MQAALSHYLPFVFQEETVDAQVCARVSSPGHPRILDSRNLVIRYRGAPREKAGGWMDGTRGINSET